jgi:hypothetical protein
MKMTAAIKKAVELLSNEGGMHRDFFTCRYYSDLTNTNINYRIAEKLLPYCNRYSKVNSLDDWFDFDLTKLNK